MDVIENKTENGATIVIDGKSFVNCVLDNCTLVYHGNQEVGLVNTVIKNCNIQLLGNAGHVAQTLRAMGWKAPHEWDKPAAIPPGTHFA